MKKNKKVLIIGITGQDGSYLANLLLKKKYKVFGLSRRNSSIENLKKLNIYTKIKIFRTKYENKNLLNKILKYNFHSIYFLGGNSSVVDSFKNDISSIKSHIIILEPILEYIRNQKNKSKTKFMYACSSEIFGNLKPLEKKNEKSIKKPNSPYALSKLIGFEIIKSFREMFNLPIFSVIFFNHDSPLRQDNYVIKKIVKGSNEIKLNKKKNLMLGNINIKRDWGWGPEYMSGCIKIMEKNYFDDFIIATGKTISLKKIVEYAFKRNKLNWKKYVKLSKKHKRKFDINENYADLSKIKKKINWQPKLTYKDIVNKI